MRNYQRNTKYKLPDALYRRMLYLVRDYDRLRTLYDEMIHETPAHDGMPRGNQTGDPVAKIAARREKVFRQMEAVDQGILSVPEEYRKPVLSHVKYGEIYPSIADRKTFFKYQSMFIYAIAERLNEI